MSYKLVFSPVFKITLKRLCNFLSRKFSRALAKETKLSIQKELIERLPENPLIGPVCDRLLDLGVAGYRQLMIDEHNIVIYRVDDEKEQISILLVFDSRQSL